MKKPDLTKTPIKPMPNAWKDDPWAIDYSNIHQFLCCDKWDDGSPRVTGAISFFTQLGVLKAVVNDKHFNRRVFVEATTWDELIQLIDMAICSDSTDWKPQPRQPGSPPY